MANVVRMVIQLRRASTTEWLANKDVVPAQGEPCFDYELNTLRIGDGVKTYEQLTPIGGVGTVSVAADGSSIVLEDGVFKLAGFDAAEVGAQPRKNADGFIEWVVPAASEGMDGLLIEVDALRTDVDNLQTSVATLQEIVGVSDEGTTPLLSRIETLENKIDGTGEGSVDAKINAKINEFANKISDDGIVNTLKELVDYVADHGTEASNMAADIKTLGDLVGDTKVSVQIDTAVAGLVKVEEGKSLVADNLIAKLEAVEEGAQVNKIEEIYIGETLLEIVDKKIAVPVGAGIKASEEITVAEDGTLGIGKISFSKITQEETEIVIMDGGSAAG